MGRFKTLVKKENLYVISDLHLGNLYFNHGKSLNSLLEYLSEKNASLCINGDGLDLLMISFPKLMLDFPLIIKNIQNFFARGENYIYYVVGNHDIYLEAFLEDSGIFNVVPFLDVISGDRRIHIEHGHLYDRLFLYYPNLNTQLTKLLGLVPNLWYLGYKSSRFLLSLRNRGNLKNIPVDGPSFLRAVKELLQRGFDTVIFGHTHHTGIYDIEKNKNYVNAGCWMGKHVHYIEINKGAVNLKEWR